MRKSYFFPLRYEDVFLCTYQWVKIMCFSKKSKTLLTNSVYSEMNFFSLLPSKKLWLKSFGFHTNSQNYTSRHCFFFTGMNLANLRCFYFVAYCYRERALSHLSVVGHIAFDIHSIVERLCMNNIAISAQESFK